MNIIQSFWSCGQKDLPAFKAGWLSPEYNLMSWALSCLQLKKFYPSVTLYADDQAARLLIDTLKLPYDNVVCELNALDHYQPGLWALSKIYTYSRQTAPFLHVDGDVFIYKAFEQQLMNGELIAQNMESSTDYYDEIINSLEAGLSYFPPEIRTERKDRKPVVAYNAGILGGNDVDFFHRYCDESFRFVEKNLGDLSKINVFNFNMFFEQYLFYCRARQEGKQVSCLINGVIGDNQYKDLGELEDVPYLKTYLHLLGPYKRWENVCLQMASRLRLDYPEFYYRIIELYKGNGLPLKHDYFQFETDFSNDNLLIKHQDIKNLYLNNDINSSDDIKREYTSVFYREVWYGKSLEVVKANGINLPPSRIEQQAAGQIKAFEAYLDEVVNNNFSVISRDLLFGRDINSAEYFQYVFGDPGQVMERVLVCDHLVNITEQEFDWTVLDIPSPDDFMRSMQKDPEHTRILIVPECHQKGYSLASVDALDVLILELLSEQKSIGQLMNELGEYFETDDLDESKQEFEILVLGRLKTALLNKSVKALIPVEA